MNKIDIWSPRYKDNMVLVAKYKVSTDNLIEFTKAKHLLGKVFYASGETIRDCDLETNGKIPCYAVPMDKLLLQEG